jgi:hypothetical protein
VSRIEFLLEYFVNIKGILESTWHRIYHDVKKYFVTCSWMNYNYG